MAPGVSIKVPLGQVMQLPWLLPFLPGGQAVQAVTEVNPVTLLKRPAGQLLHIFLSALPWEPE